MTARAQLAHSGVTLGELYDEYVAGATYVELGKRYGVTPGALCKLMQKLAGEKGTAARIAMAAREAAMQDKITRIAGIASRAFHLKPGEMWRSQRKQHQVNARYAAWLVAIENRVTTTAIARAFECDHTTVMHGRDRARAMEANDEIYRAWLNRVRREAAQ